MYLSILLTFFFEIHPQKNSTLFQLLYLFLAPYLYLKTFNLADHFTILTLDAQNFPNYSQKNTPNMITKLYFLTQLLQILPHMKESQMFTHTNSCFRAKISYFKIGLQWNIRWYQTVSSIYRWKVYFSVSAFSISK